LPRFCIVIKLYISLSFNSLGDLLLFISSVYFAEEIASLPLAKPKILRRQEDSFIILVEDALKEKLEIGMAVVLDHFSKRI
jgi:hypothetical protein